MPKSRFVQVNVPSVTPLPYRGAVLLKTAQHLIASHLANGRNRRKLAVRTRPGTGSHPNRPSISQGARIVSGIPMLAVHSPVEQCACSKNSDREYLQPQCAQQRDQLALPPCAGLPENALHVVAQCAEAEVEAFRNNWQASASSPAICASRSVKQSACRMKAGSRPAWGDRAGRQRQARLSQETRLGHVL